MQESFRMKYLLVLMKSFALNISLVQNSRKHSLPKEYRLLNMQKRFFLVKMKKMKLFRSGITEKVNNSVTLLEGDHGMKK